MKEMINKIKSVMIGHAVGDALGVPVEFFSRDEMAKYPVFDMEGYGTYEVPKGTWSDDTSMSLAALDSLAKGKIDHFEIMKNFAKWLDYGEYTPFGDCFDIGRTCMTAIRSFMLWYISDEKERSEFNALEFGQCGERDNGNGSLMRIHPFALMTWFRPELKCDFERIIDEASALTHAHGRSKLACRIYTVILHNLLSCPTKESIFAALDMAKKKYADETEYSYYARLLDGDFHMTVIDEIKSSGYVVDTLEAAVWCLLTTDSYKECVLKAVNLGEDTDTVAAIAGGLAGGLYGYDAIPEEWRNILVKREYIEEMCERACEAWK